MSHKLRKEQVEHILDGFFSNYCGPGGSGRVLHKVDSICKKHDEEYGKLQQRGINPYTCYNKPDEIFLHELSQVGPKGLKELITKLGGQGYFKLKKLIAPYCKQKLQLISQSSSEDTHHSQSHSLTETNMAQAMINHKKRRGDPIEHSHGHQQHNMEGAPEEGGEEQVTKPHHIWRRFPNTQTAALKWCESIFTNTGTFIRNSRQLFGNTFEQTATSLLTTGGGAVSNPIPNSLLTGGVGGTDYSTPYMFQMRMTSPYNIIKQLPSASGGTASQPVWLSYFDSKYQYYHCMETEWEINFHFGVPQLSGSNVGNFQAHGLYIFWKYTEQDDPPTFYNFTASTIANATIATSNVLGSGYINPDTVTAQLATGTPATIPLTSDDYFRMGGWHHKHVTFNTTHHTNVVLEGTYKYGQCKMDLKTISPTDVTGSDTTAEGWAQTGSTPVFPELLTVIIVNDCSMTNIAGVLVPTGIKFETEQLIQFKDLRANYKFPTPSLAQSG